MRKTNDFIVLHCIVLQHTYYTFEEALDHITQKRKTMGIEEFILDRTKKEGIQIGIEQGEQQKAIAFTKKLLNETAYSIEEIAHFVGESVGFVNKIKEGKL